MHLKEFYIDNFRGYRKFKIKSNHNINILTGVNNSGKTTILEAISLWNEIFNHLITKARRSDQNLGIRSGDFRFGKKGQNYIDYREINSVRSFGYKDLFYNLNTSAAIKVSALVVLPNKEEINIGFIMKEANGANYNVYLNDHDQFDFIKFNNAFTGLPESVGCYFSTPVATISSYEEFAIAPKIKDGIKIRQSSIYFRNRLFNLYNSDEFAQFKKNLSNVLYNENDCIDFKINGDKSKDIYISIEVNIKSTGYRNISLLGSGTIQIIEILLHLHENRKALNIILLDEPDSHIHRDIQRRLLKHLKNSGVQVFLTTHNESLIRSAKPDSLFFIDDTVSNNSLTEFIPIGQKRLPQRKIGIASSHHSKLINQIGSETSLDILNALESEKILFVEGVDDSQYIQKLMEINNIEKDCVFWSFGGLDKLLSKIKHYKEFFRSLGSNRPIWEKCSIIIDADFMTDQQKNNLKAKLEEKLGLQVFIWKSYTIESTVLSDVNLLERLIALKCTNQDVTVETTEIIEIIRNNIDSKKNEKLQMLNEEEDLSKRILGQMEARISNLDSNLNISQSSIFEDVRLPHLFNHFRLYSSQKLAANEVSHICNKDDVEDILEKIYDDLGLEKNEEFENHFSAVLDIVEITSLNREWSSLLQFIEN